MFVYVCICCDISIYLCFVLCFVRVRVCVRFSVFAHAHVCVLPCCFVYFPRIQDISVTRILQLPASTGVLVLDEANARPVSIVAQVDSGLN